MTFKAILDTFDNRGEHNHNFIFIFICGVWEKSENRPQNMAFISNLMQKSVVVSGSIRRAALPQIARQFSDATATTATTDDKLGGFAKAFQRHSASTEEAPQVESRTFASLLRNSKFVDVSRTSLFLTLIYYST